MLKAILLAKAPDVFSQIETIGKDFLKNIQSLGWISLALALAAAGFSWLFGGRDGMQKAKPIIIGGIVGFIFIMGASAIATYFKGSITF
ncbi:TrbC/VirB2 family protein [Clostridium baratii]|uniref:TrbC/VirB2 family protein n=1 Tax=Clostridium baratii TaxID=1561 RepID=UPI0030D025FE